MDLKDYKRRHKFYDRCQEMVDTLHARVSANEFLDEEQCKRLFGTADYNAFLYELHKHNADIDYTVMTPAMEWMYHSRYFLWLKGQENKGRCQTVTNWAMLIIAVVSAVSAAVSAYYAAHQS